MSSTIDIPVNKNDVVDDEELNSKTLKCPRSECRSVILKPRHAKWTTTDSKYTLPSFRKDAATSTTKPTDFWVLHDMMSFENIGFSKTVAQDGSIVPTDATSSEEPVVNFPPGVKFLSCADCDVGPLGYHDTSYTNSSGQREFLIAIDRVRYE